MKLVAVSQRVDLYLDRNERRDALDQRLGAFLLAAGFLPVPIPNILQSTAGGGATEGSFNAWLEAIDPQALLLSGGNDIGTCGKRDQIESRLLNHARKCNMPVLGVCRGMQMMGVWAGASLRAVTGHVCARHQLDGEISGEVNSYHNLALTKCPPGFECLAESSDGEIEAIRERSLPWEGWMWHPERDVPFHPRDIQRVQKLFGV
jgi:N5-(cytidine 5'-diphosphoramidyl)-L-glutamine hydrolase